MELTLSFVVILERSGCFCHHHKEHKYLCYLLFLIIPLGTNLCAFNIAPTAVTAASVQH